MSLAFKKVRHLVKVYFELCIDSLMNIAYKRKSLDSIESYLIREIYWMASLSLLKGRFHYDSSCGSVPHQGSNHTPVDTN